jgi:hypothetical protein
VACAKLSGGNKLRTDIRVSMVCHLFNIMLPPPVAAGCVKWGEKPSARTESQPYNIRSIDSQRWLH